MYTYAKIYTHTNIYKYTHQCKHLPSLTLTHTCKHTFTHTYTYMYMPTKKIVEETITSKNNVLFCECALN